MSTPIKRYSLRHSGRLWRPRHDTAHALAGERVKGRRQWAQVVTLNRQCEHLPVLSYRLTDLTAPSHLLTLHGGD